MNAPSFARLGRIVLALTLAGGCGEPVEQPDAGAEMDSGSPALDGGPDGGDAATTMHDAAAPPPDSGPPPDAGPPTCDTLDCDDGIACTDDRCSASTCSHEVRHELCATGSYCDATLGCVGGEACATDDDCPASPGGCFGPARCVPDTRTCTYPVLDGDMDGYGPPVCGGTDCNDADPTVHPDALEDCDGVDDDCSGAVDAPLAEDACRDDQSCIAGTCGCAAGQEDCYGRCTDTSSDAEHCGACNVRCGANEACVGGECTCEAPFAECGFRTCVDRDTDPNNCGVCGYRCVAGSLCVGGSCECPSGQTACPLGCAELGTVDNCMGCGDACGAGATCTATGCSPSFPWLVAWDTHDDSYVSAQVAVAADGSIVEAGAYTSALYDAIAGGSTPIVSGAGVFVSKHDASGARQWVHRWSRSGGTSSSGYSVIDTAVGDDGSIYVLLQGRYNLLLDDGTTITGGSTTQTLIVGLDVSGAYRWHRFSGGTATAYALDVTGSEITILGESTGTVNFGGGALSGFGAPGFVAVLDSTGAHLHSFRTAIHPQLLARSGDVLWVAGTFTGTLTLGSTTLSAAASGWDVYAAQLTTAGTFTGAFRFGLAENDTVTALTVLSGGDVVLSMSAASLARLTPAGELVWYVDEDVSYYVLATDASDRIYAANRTGSLMLRRFGSDGAAQLDVPIEARSIDLSARSALVGIGGVWERSVTVGGRTVRSSYTGSSGVWISTMEAP